MLILRARLSFRSWAQRELNEHINIMLIQVIFFSARTIFRYRKLKNLKNTIILWLKIDDNILLYVRRMHCDDFKSRIVLYELWSKNIYKHINIILVHVILFFSAKTIFRYRKFKNLQTTIILWLEIDYKLILYVRGIHSAHCNSQIVLTKNYT